MEETILARVAHGSRLFGLDTEKSDYDFIEVYVPSARDIILGKNQDITTLRPSGNSNDRSLPGDIEVKRYPATAFVAGLGNGVLELIEIVNAPESFHVIEPNPAFRRLMDDPAAFASRDISSILGFCRRMARSYRPHQGDIAAFETAAAIFERARSGLRWGKIPAENFFGEIQEALPDGKAEVLFIKGGSTKHLNVCGKNVAATVHAKTAYDIMKLGHRQAVRAEAEAGVDNWKALSHALRVAIEGKQYVQSGRIVFPLSEAAHIRRVKTGQVPFDEVMDEIEHRITEFEAAAACSVLPAEPDLAPLEEFLIDVSFEVIDGELRAGKTPNLLRLS